MSLLQVENLHVRYGAIHALKGVNLTLHKGEILALIGSNGAGKSSFLRCLSGVIPAADGKIIYQSPEGVPVVLNHKKPYERVALGIAQVPEGRQIFANLSVRENLELGAFVRDEIDEEVWDWILNLFPRLNERLNQMAGHLSGGEQQMLAIGRALMSKPHLLILDEPSLGIAPALVEQIFSSLVEVNNQGVSILLVEQDAHLALRTASRGQVLETGEVVLVGNANDLLHNPMVKKAYLGE